MNPAYDIGDFYELSEKLRSLNKDMQLITDYQQKNNIRDEKYKEMCEFNLDDPDFPTKRVGMLCCGRNEAIDLEFTKTEIAETKR